MYIATKSYRELGNPNQCTAAGDKGTKECILFYPATKDENKCIYRKDYGCDWCVAYSDNVKGINK